MTDLSDVKIDLVVHGWDLTDEQQDILETFVKLLLPPTGDGAVKRAAGVKPYWRVDDGHHAAFHRHLDRIQFNGESVDRDSGGMAWAHVGWRALAMGAQEAGL